MLEKPLKKVKLNLNLLIWKLFPSNSQQSSPIDDKQIELMEKLIDHLEDLDDVQKVYHNWEID